MYIYLLNRTHIWQDVILYQSRKYWLLWFNVSMRGVIDLRHRFPPIRLDIQTIGRLPKICTNIKVGLKCLRGISHRSFRLPKLSKHFPHTSWTYLFIVLKSAIFDFDFSIFYYSPWFKWVYQSYVLRISHIVLLFIQNGCTLKDLFFLFLFIAVFIFSNRGFFWKKLG